MSTRSRADANCRLCHGSLESIQHLVSACPHLAPTRYVDRHNSIVRYLHWALSILHQVPDVHRSHYRHCLKTVVYGKDVRLFWEFTVPTVVPLRANRPDLILVDDRAKTALLIDVSVPLDSNINIKVSEKRLKYAPPCIELKNLWVFRRPFFQLWLVPSDVRMDKWSRLLTALDVAGFPLCRSWHCVVPVAC